ncbi:hypothetical protein Golob_009925 [Gossypium lobatum]|uniref:S1 motif domain-containing protein n=1 Tax=Gossypium lobatum TaxID=34289 RepID=A0A7J8MJY3_9ROSI|nr:hypothetical protein [Gossypium lobatum]
MQLHPRHFGRNQRENLVSELMKDAEVVDMVCGGNNRHREHRERLDSRRDRMGFFAEAGPVQIFVSNHLIPDDMEFQSGDMPNYTTSDGSVKIQKDSEVRLKIIGTRVDATEIVHTLTLSQLIVL